MSATIELIYGDITQQQVDVIVNAAKNSLLGGGGVDGAIHRKAGPELLEECKTLGGCKTGEAKYTKAYNLPAKWIVHTVGPMWVDGTQNEQESLASCYRNSLDIAAKLNAKTIAFPSISTGVYFFPIDLAAQISLDEIKNFLKTPSSIEKVTLVCFQKDDYDVHMNLMEKQ